MVLCARAGRKSAIIYRSAKNNIPTMTPTKRIFKIVTISSIKINEKVPNSDRNRLKYDKKLSDSLIALLNIRVTFYFFICILINLLGVYSHMETEKGKQAPKSRHIVSGQALRSYPRHKYYPLVTFALIFRNYLEGVLPCQNP